MSYALEGGRRFRVLNVIDDFSRECPVAVVNTSFGGAHVARKLDRSTEFCDYVYLVLSDNGAELTSNAMPKWQEGRIFDWHCIAPGEPTQNGPIQRFNGRMRGKC